MKKIWAVIKREYLQIVRTKGFIIGTVLGPVIMSLFIVILASLSYSRVFGIQDIFWDDNCWLLATYSSNNLGEFLNAGLLQLRREFMGVWMYFLLDLHKNTEYFYLVINSVNMITQVITPLFLFLFLKNLSKQHTGGHLKLL